MRREQRKPFTPTLSAYYAESVIRLWSEGCTVHQIAADLGVPWSSAWWVVRKERIAGNPLAAARPPGHMRTVKAQISAPAYDALQRFADDARLDLPDWTVEEQAGCILEDAVFEALSEIEDRPDVR